MASYPPELALVSSSMRNFLVQTVEIQPRSVRICNPGDTLRIRIPENTLCDLSSFVLRGDVVGIRPDGDDTQCILPADSSSLIQDLSVSVNHTLVDHLRDYAHVAALFIDMQDGNVYSKKRGMRHGELFVPNNENLPAIGIDALAGPQGVLQPPGSANADILDADANALPYCWQDWYGFLGQNRWIHTGYTGPIEVLIRFAPKDVVMSTTENGDASYQIQSLKAHIMVATIEDNLFDELMSQRLSSGGLVLPFKKYLTHRGELLRGSGSVPWSVVTKSLDAAYCILLDPKPSRKAPELPRGKRLSRLVRKVTTNGVTTDVFAGKVKSCHCTVQGVQYPQFRPAPHDWWFLALQNFRQHGNKYDRCAAVSDSINLKSWLESHSFFGYRWSWDAVQDGTGVESGLDSQNLEFYGTFEYDVTIPTNATVDFEVSPLVIIETTASLFINPMRELTLIA